MSLKNTTDSFIRHSKTLSASLSSVIYMSSKNLYGFFPILFFTKPFKHDRYINNYHFAFCLISRIIITPSTPFSLLPIRFLWRSNLWSIFSTFGIIPTDRKVVGITEGIQWNYTSWLNIIFLIIAAILIYRFMKSGGMAMLRMMDNSEHKMSNH